MRHLVGDDIVEHRLGREDQPPAEREIAACRAASPAALRIAHSDSRHVVPDPCGEPTRPASELTLRLRHEVITDAARQMHWIAPHADFAVDDRDGGRAGFDRAADPVWNAEPRPDRAFGERHWPWQGFKARRNPSAFGRQKAQAIA